MSTSARQRKDSFMKRLFLVFFTIVLVLLLYGLGHETLATAKAKGSNAERLSGYSSYESIDENFARNFHRLLMDQNS